MYNAITPESAGISSQAVYDYFDYLNRRGIVMHSVLLAKGEDIFAECYYAPFDKDFNHRMYSQTKSYVALAIGCLLDEGKLSLSDKIVSFFPEKIHTKVGKYLAEQTVEDMLTMTTNGNCPFWFTAPNYDRTELYLNEQKDERPSGTIWQYDSAGSQVLANLVEKLSGMSLLDYLKAKLFNEMGTMKNAQILKARNDDSWGDSALICTPRDMMATARLLLNGGKWKGKQLLSESYVKKAISPLVDNDETGFYDCFHSHGYGYQIWNTEMGGFAFVGMGGQLTIAIPALDAIFVCTGDNQGYASSYNIIVNGLFDYVFRKMDDKPLPENAAAHAKLLDFCANQKLAHLTDKGSDFAQSINGVKYACEPNRMGISEFTLNFDGTCGVLKYVNAQGEKELPFGLGYNEFALFPQLGYDNDHGGVVTTDGFKYRCATSAGWTEHKKLRVKVQVIDRYFGNIIMTFAFKGDLCTLTMAKTAENFFQQYHGLLVAKRQD